MNIKHIGRLKANGRKVFIAYRTLPGESDAALVIFRDQLSDSYHDSLERLVESTTGQNAYELAEVLARSTFEDGANMLQNLHFSRKLIKIGTSDIEVTPNNQMAISLDQLNQDIATQRNVSVNDLALKNSSSVDEIAKINDISSNSNVVAESQVATTESVLSDFDIARKYRADAAGLLAEAARLEALAESLDPTQKVESAPIVSDSLFEDTVIQITENISKGVENPSSKAVKPKSTVSKK